MGFKPFLSALPPSLTGEWFVTTCFKKPSSRAFLPFLTGEIRVPKFSQLFDMLFAAYMLAQGYEEYTMILYKSNTLENLLTGSGEQALAICERSAEPGRFQINNERLERLFPHISASAHKIYTALGMRLGSENTRVVMSSQELQEVTGLSKQTVRTGLNELEREFMLLTRRGANAQREYMLNEMYLCRCK